MEQRFEVELFALPVVEMPMAVGKARLATGKNPQTTEWEAADCAMKL